MARRIVPELISPSQAVAVQPAFESVAEQPLNLRFDLKEQAELAKTMLEPGRKFFVDVSQDSKVNWRKVRISCCCKAAIALVDWQSVQGVKIVVAEGCWGSESKATTQDSASTIYAY